jgi:hypothetical protein
LEKDISPQAAKSLLGVESNFPYKLQDSALVRSKNKIFPTVLEIFFSIATRPQFLKYQKSKRRKKNKAFRRRDACSLAHRR